ncbi:MAG TPA: hypothetical protein VL134_05395 [Leptolyngbya sp.]|nr:hypothetical protein [Leptolyngbya sp.]
MRSVADREFFSIQFGVNDMPECPCCSEKLLRHVRHGKVYWFCTHCWQEMPNLEAVIGDAVMTPKKSAPKPEIVLS